MPVNRPDQQGNDHWVVEIPIGPLGRSMLELHGGHGGEDDTCLCAASSGATWAAIMGQTDEQVNSVKAPSVRGRV